MTKKPTKAAFRRYLNELCKDSPNHKHGPYHQLKREYGDYLYHQDRNMFDNDYAEWIEKGCPEAPIKPLEQNMAKPKQVSKEVEALIHVAAQADADYSDILGDMHSMEQRVKGLEEQLLAIKEERRLLEAKVLQRKNLAEEAWKGVRELSRVWN